MTLRHQGGVHAPHVEESKEPCCSMENEHPRRTCREETHNDIIGGLTRCAVLATVREEGSADADVRQGGVDTEQERPPTPQQPPERHAFEHGETATCVRSNKPSEQTRRDSQPEIAMAAGEKRSGANAPPAKRHATGRATSPPPQRSPEIPGAARTPHKDATDDLAGIGLHRIVLNRAKSTSIQHACLHSPETDDGTCACCFAGGSSSTPSPTR